MLPALEGTGLAGRIDSSNQEAAIAKVAKVIPYASEIREHLQKVLESPAFCGSHRSQEFLKYIVETALNGQCDQLKERTIGALVFGREPGYDTGDDAVVRVTANDVRRRLLRCYSELGTEPRFRIVLPPGSYIPEFQPSAGSDISQDTDRSFTAQEQLSQRFKLSSQHFKPWILAALIFSVLGWLSGALVARHSVASAHPEASVAHAEQYAFYKELLGPIAQDRQMETAIVLSNPHLLLYRGNATTETPYGDDPNLAYRVPPALEKQLNPTANDDQANNPIHFLVANTEDYTGMGEANAAIWISILLQGLGRPIRVTQSRFLNWETARKEHLILLGAPHMSAWTQQSLNRANFIMSHDAILNTHPLPTEQATYPNHTRDGLQEDYGLIWMAHSPSGSRLLLLAGLSSTGTAGIGEFFCDPEKMRPVYEKLKAAAGSKPIPEEWQALIKISARDHIPISGSFVALRVYDSAP